MILIHKSYILHHITLVLVKKWGLRGLLTTYEQNIFSYFFDAASAIRFESVTKP